MTKFYIEHKHNYVSLSNMTFSDYVNSDRTLCDQIFQAYVAENNLVVTDDNVDQLRQEMVYQFLQYERMYA